MKALILEEMIHPEVAEILPKVEIAVVPVGSCEQHGPNTTYVTDTARAYAFCKLLGEHYGEKLLICPPVTYGVSTHHMGFAGTVTLRPETYIEVLKDIAVALHKHGIPKILFVNGHGGNISSLNVAINSLKYSHGIDAYYTGMGFGVFDDAVTPEMLANVQLNSTLMMFAVKTQAQLNSVLAAVPQTTMLAIDPTGAREELTMPQDRALWVWLSGTGKYTPYFTGFKLIFR